jgi:hypothetical protein
MVAFSRFAFPLCLCANVSLVYLAFLFLSDVVPLMTVQLAPFRVRSFLGAFEFPNKRAFPSMYLLTLNDRFNFHLEIY